MKRLLYVAALTFLFTTACGKSENKPAGITPTDTSTGNKDSKADPTNTKTDTKTDNTKKPTDTGPKPVLTGTIRWKNTQGQWVAPQDFQTHSFNIQPGRRMFFSFTCTRKVNGKIEGLVHADHMVKVTPGGDQNPPGDAESDGQLTLQHNFGFTEENGKDVTTEYVATCRADGKTIVAKVINTRN